MYGIIVAVIYILFTAFDLYSNKRGYNTSREVLIRLIIPLIVAIVWNIVFFDFTIWLILPTPIFVFLLRYYADFRLDAIGFEYRRFKIIIKKEFNKVPMVYQARLYEDTSASIKKGKLVEILEDSISDLKERYKSEDKPFDERYRKKLKSIKDKINKWENFKILCLYHFGYSSVVPKEYEKWYFITDKDIGSRVLITSVIEIGTTTEYATKFREYIAFHGSLDNTTLESIQKFKSGLKDVVALPKAEQIFSLKNKIARLQKTKRNLQQELMIVDSENRADTYKKEGKFEYDYNSSKRKMNGDSVEKFKYMMSSVLILVVVLTLVVLLSFII